MQRIGGKPIWNFRQCVHNGFISCESVPAPTTSRHPRHRCSATGLETQTTIPDRLFCVYLYLYFIYLRLVKTLSGLGYCSACEYRIIAVTRPHAVFSRLTRIIRERSVKLQNAFTRRRRRQSIRYLTIVFTRLDSRARRIYAYDVHDNRHALCGFKAERIHATVVVVYTTHRSVMCNLMSI